jgi:hypothetical protein
MENGSRHGAKRKIYGHYRHCMHIIDDGLTIQRRDVVMRYEDDFICLLSFHSSRIIKSSTFYIGNDNPKIYKSIPREHWAFISSFFS